MDGSNAGGERSWWWQGNVPTRAVPPDA